MEGADKGQESWNKSTIPQAAIVSQAYLPSTSASNSYSLPSVVQERGVSPVKRKRIQMTDAECLRHSRTSDGAKPLTNPAHHGLAKHPQWDGNRGLYPRPSQQRRSSPQGAMKRSPQFKRKQSSPSSSPAKQTRLENFFLPSPKKAANPSCLALSGSPEQGKQMQGASRKCSPQSVINIPAPAGYTRTDAERDGHTPSSMPQRQWAPNQRYSSQNSLTQPGSCSAYPAKRKTFSIPSSTMSYIPHHSTQSGPSTNQRSSPHGRTVCSAQSKAVVHVRKPACTATRSLFPEAPQSSAALVKHFEEDDSITAEMFDRFVGSHEQQPLPAKNESSSSLEKDFEDDDDAFTVEEFDDILKSSQDSVTRNKKHQEDGNLEKDFEDDDSFTAEDFDEVLQLSQSPAKISPCKTPLLENRYRSTNIQGNLICHFENGRDLASKPGTSRGNDAIPECSRNKQKNIGEPAVDAYPKTSSSPSRPCTFGLLGEESVDDPEDGGATPKDYFSNLPDEILENILGQLPILDMCVTATTVCKRWKEIISGHRFVPWKKRYHQLKKLQKSEQMKEIMDLMMNNKGVRETSCLSRLITFMSSMKVTHSYSLTGLKQHTRYADAVHMMKVRTPEVFTDQEPHPWSAVAAMVVLSQTAQEVSQILSVLLVRKEPVPRMEVSECLYCIATLLFLFQIKFNINRGLHYRVFHTLHILESGGTEGKEVLAEAAQRSTEEQQSLFKYNQSQGMPLTAEQKRIISHELLPTDTIKIVAFAGTGKTTTLIRFAQLRPHLSFLYVAFNKTVQLHAQKNFPRNVECRTLHSLAYRAVGFKYRSKLGTGLKPFFISHLLPELPDRCTPCRSKRKPLHHMTLAKHVCATINTFLASDDGFMTTAHTPMWDTTRTPRRALHHEDRMTIAESAQGVFDSMCNLQNTDARMTHDLYLKLYEMQQPKLNGYDCLLIDEAQDLTPAQQSILLKQTCAKILVGDPHQQIYSFRGATNAMERVEATRIYHLTQSFRFGPEIAYVANCLLEALKGQTKSTIIGAGPQGCVLGKFSGPIATICRTNSAIFMEAEKLIRQNDKVKIEFTGGIEGYGFDKLLDIYYLSLPPEQRGGHYIRDKFIARFKSFHSLKTYATSVEDAELTSRIKTVLQFHSRIPSLVEKIKRASVKMNGDWLLMTAHKAKGLEFDTVQLSGDFANETMDIQGNDIPEDEKNTLYVAVTRAKKSLLLNHSLLNFLKKVMERFEYPLLAKKVMEEKGPQRCADCKTVDHGKNQLLLLERKAVEIVGMRSIQAGVICSTCATVPGFEELYGKR